MGVACFARPVRLLVPLTSRRLRRYLTLTLAALLLDDIQNAQR